MAHTPFKVGDLVRLKSGGPKMTVNDVRGGPEGILCFWFAGEKLENARFEPDALELASGEDKG
jgi:uncharacterized protein YodC (DUF2158 family)